MKTIRKIIKIDEDLCNGCGQCAISCAEGSLEIVNGKAKIISDKYCDGLGACIGECPTGALTIVEREAEEFDAEAVEKHLADQKPSATTIGESMLSHWPVQIRLIPSNAPFLKGADLLVVADCVPAAFPRFHTDLVEGKVLMMGCPKFDDVQEYIDKFKEILNRSHIKSITVGIMEVPCCSGLPMILKQAMKESGETIPMEKVVISTKGKVLLRTHGS
jgi:Pyruvate/2-oxoacid:ferredoxin oxidoreductase delta subunit